jgi:hypothetical protein
MGTIAVAWWNLQASSELDRVVGATDEIKKFPSRGQGV